MIKTSHTARVHYNKMIKKSKRMVNKFFYPSPDERQNDKLGYEPNAAIKFLRFIADIFIKIFMLNSNNRLIVEIQQKICPVIKVNIGNGEHLKFTSGHGRLIWRAKTILSEETSIIDWINGFNRDDIFYDIGANIGIYSLYACKQRKCKVFSFEAELNNAQLLYSNLYLNNLSSRCTPIVLACHSENGVKPFYIREFTKGGAINSIDKKSFQLEDESKMFTQNTLCFSLDDLVQIASLPKPTNIKIDVDGNELSVIRGALKTLEHVTSIYIELFDEMEDHNLVKKILLNDGFKIISREKVKATPKYENMANYIFSK